MDGLRADDQGAHIQHAIEHRNNVENWAPAGEGKIEPQELGHKALKSIASKVIEALKSRSFKERAMAIGRVLAERHARIAERLGNKRAREWAEDPNFVMYLGATWLNTPPMFRHAL
jgi:hypothetical protein